MQSQLHERKHICERWRGSLIGRR